MFLKSADGGRSYRMFEVNMDEYLDEEVEYLKTICDNICKDWDRQVRR
jgi:recyclin-1